MWEISPIVLDLSEIYCENDSPFHEVNLMYHLYAHEFGKVCMQVPIVQGTTIVSVGQDPSGTRYVALWNQWVENHKAYLKFAGMMPNGTILPFNHVDFPSFILVVPACITDVPKPGRIQSLIDPKDYSNTYRNDAGDLICCVICSGIRYEELMTTNVCKNL